MPSDSQPTLPDRPPLLRAIGVLVITQVLGWATTYHAPVVFARPIAQDLGIAYDQVFLGITVFLITTGLVGPSAGRLIDAHGARRIMAAGSLMLALGLVVVAHAQGLIGYLLGWTLLGLGCGLGLYNSAFVALTQIVGAGARRAIGIMTLITVCAVILVHPFNNWMLATVGWRNAYLVYAGLHLVIGVPLHLLALPQRRDQRATANAATTDPFPLLADDKRLVAKVVFVLAYAMAGLIGWGLPLHFVTLFRDNGIDPTVAVWIAGLSGPAQATARLIETTLGERNHPLTSAFLSFAVAPTAFVVLLFAPHSEAGSMLFVLFWGLSAGAVALTRASVPLVLFGHVGYGTTMGRLTMPLNFVFALSPILFARLLDIGGPTLVLQAALGISLLAVLTITQLARLAGAPLLPRLNREP